MATISSADCQQFSIDEFDICLIVDQLDVIRTLVAESAESEKILYQCDTLLLLLFECMGLEEFEASDIGSTFREWIDETRREHDA